MCVANWPSEGVPVTADYDYDGKADPAMVDADGRWWIWFSARSYEPGRSSHPMCVANWPSEGVPVFGDFDADGRADPAMVDADGYWTIWLDGMPMYVTNPMSVEGGVPVVGDFDHDGRADPAMVDADGYWTIWFSTDRYAPGRSTLPMGVTGGVPMVGDFDGDGLADPGMVVDNNWTFWLSWDNYLGRMYEFLP